MTKFRPLEGFATALIPLLIKASAEPQIFYAEAGEAPPKVLPLTTTPDESTVSTRWHRLRFSTPEAARRFRSFQHLAHELHELRRSMKHFAHPNASDVYRVKIAIDDYTGSLRIRSHDATLAELLGASIDSTNEPELGLLPEVPFDDPLNPKEEPTSAE